MRKRNCNRRKFMGMAGSFIAASPVLARTGTLSALPESTALGPRESLKKLVMVIGPWGKGEQKTAEYFADRFVRHEHNSGPYLDGPKDLVVSLAARFPDGAAALDNIDLKGLPDGERELLIELAGHVYTLTEVRFHLTGELPRGVCQPDRMGYTKPPKQDK